MRSPIFAHAADMWRQMRAEFQDYLEAQMTAAQRDLGPHLLRRSSDATTESVFTGPWQHAQAHASPELIEWWEQHGRMTVTEYEHQWLAARKDNP